MSRKSLALLILITTATMVLGCSCGGLIGPEPTATFTPTKTLVPTFTATPSIVPSPTDTPPPTSTATPTVPPQTPTPTQMPTPTLGPPTNTPTPRPPAPTATPRPPTPTSTPQPVYEYQLIQEPTKDPCHPGWCIPEVSGNVVDAQGNPVDNYNRVTIKLECARLGALYCPTGDPEQLLQPGQFKFVSPDSQVFGEYTLTVVRSKGDPTSLSPVYNLKMNAYTRGQQTNIIFQRTY